MTAIVDVDRNLDGAEPHGAEPGEHELGAVAEQQEDAIAARDAESCEAAATTSAASAASP